MNDWNKKTTRRSFVKGTAALAGMGALGMLPGAEAFGAGFPSRRINFVVPTRAGGGADRDLRTFNKVWAKYINTKFKLDFFPWRPGPGGLRGLPGQARTRRLRSAFRKYGAGSDHVRPAKAEL